jgi:hypothetical protein
MLNLKTYQNNWTGLRVEIKKLCEQLNIDSTELSEVNVNHWQDIEEKIWKKFSTRKNSRWIWESLKNPTYGFHIDFPHLRLTDIIDKNEQVWFLLDETVNEKTKFWIYEGEIEPFIKVIWESYRVDEILIVSKKLEWLISYNHHDILIGTEKKIKQLQQLESKVKAGNKS